MGSRSKGLPASAAGLASLLPPLSGDHLTDCLLPAQARKASSSSTRSAVHRQLKKRAKVRPMKPREPEGQHALSGALAGLHVLFENTHVCVLSKPAGCGV